ncbi:MAG: acyl-CoA thioesterase II [Rhizobiales bacterium]|nr:acyl-CoA thioesterase II [Hyphomicrobiales bacterium]
MPANPQPALEALLAILDLEQLEVNLFRGQSPQDGWQRVYGGQVIGQAFVAASRTVDGELHGHSLHAYFLRPGDPRVPIIYEVDRLRDGKSFVTRRVIARQHGEVIYAMSASFHIDEVSFTHQASMPPGVPAPEGLPTERELKALFIEKLPANMRQYWERDRPIEMRPVDLSRYATREPMRPEQLVWFRANGRLPDDRPLHQCVLAYASDFTLLDTALIAHGKLLFDADIQLASLDHALWVHDDFRADEWLLYVQDSPWAGGARGFCRGSIYTRDGRLVASVAQEGLMRQRPSQYLAR